MFSDSGGKFSPHGGDSSNKSSDNESGDNYKDYYSERKKMICNLE
jgi:hypothetical protein